MGKREAFTKTSYPSAKLRPYTTAERPITLEELRRREHLPAPEVHVPEVLHVEQHSRQQARENKWGKSTFSLIKPKR